MATEVEGIEIPYNWNHNWTQQNRAYEAAIKATRRTLRRKSRGAWVGALISWQVADGYATYIVVQEQPLQVAHIDYCDGYTVDPIMIRGLQLSDIEERCEKP
jgi:hypothetical protein